MSDILSFPKDFIWGTATSSFQIEGAADERGMCIWDEFCRWPGKVLNGDTGDVANDHVHRYREDVAMMAELGMQTYRFSIAWPRVLPAGKGKVDEAGLDFYDKLVDELLKYNIQPAVTLYHWDLPSELQKLGGWASRDTIYRFQDYTEVVANRLGDRVKTWITHNEPWVVSMLGNLTGDHAPGVEDRGIALQVAHHLLVSHGLSMQVLRELGGADAQVGITLNMNHVYPATDRDEDQLAASRSDGQLNRWFADPIFKGSYPEDMWDVYGAQVPRIEPDDMAIISQPIDFLGVNYYTRDVAKYDASKPLEYTSLHPAGEYTAMDWEVYPQGLTDLLMRLTNDYAPKAIYITENGCAYPDVVEDGKVHDVKRIDYYRKHFVAAHKAIEMGAPLKGYYAWSLMDNFEWAWGYERRFGIVYVDFKTQERILKDSARYYSQVVQQNGVEI